MKRIFGLFFILVIIGSLLAACGSDTNPGAAAAKAISPGLLNKAKTYWSEGQVKQNNVSNLWIIYTTQDSKFRAGALELIQNNQSCFKSVAETESEIAKAALGGMTGDAIIKALATQSVSGEQATTACVGLNVRLADYITSNREAVAQAYANMRIAANDYKLWTASSPEVDIMNDLMDTYLNTQGVYDFLAQNGIGVTDWTWLPTTMLEAHSTDKEGCFYYINGDFKQNLLPEVKRKFIGHENSLDSLYAATWNPTAFKGRGECRMYRMAALEYMTRDIVNSQTREVQESGEDGSVYDQLTPKPDK